MACETENTIIDGTTYVCTQFPAIISMKYKLKVLKVFGPVIGEIIPMVGKNADSDSELNNITNAIEKLFSTNSPDEIIDLIVEILTAGTVMCDSKPLTKPAFEEIYSGDRILEAYKAFAFVLKVNYRGFFKGQKAKELLAKMEPKV